MERQSRPSRLSLFSRFFRRSPTQPARRSPEDRSRRSPTGPPPPAPPRAAPPTHAPSLTSVAHLGSLHPPRVSPAVRAPNAPHLPPLGAAPPPAGSVPPPPLPQLPPLPAHAHAHAPPPPFPGLAPAPPPSVLPEPAAPGGAFTLVSLRDRSRTGSPPAAAAASGGQREPPQELRFRRQHHRPATPAAPPTSSSSTAAAAPSAPSRGVGGFFRRLFRRGPTTVSVQPFDPPSGASSPDSISLASNPSGASIALAPGALERADSGHGLTRLVRQDSRRDSRVLNRFRDELLEALAIAMLDQQEMESAEMELNQLKRLADIIQFDKAVSQLEAHYHEELRRNTVPMDALVEIESRLLIARLVLSVESVSAALLKARQRHGDASLDVLRLAITLEQHVRLLSVTFEDEPSLRQLMMHERVTARAMLFPDEPQPVHVLPADLQGVFHHLRTRPHVDRSEAANLGSIGYRIKCQELRLGFLRQRAAGKVEISVRRDQIVSDSRSLLMHLPSTHLRRRLFVKYQGEDGNDFGGLSRDWVYLLSQRVVQQAVAQGQLLPSTNDPGCLQIAPSAKPTAECLRDFEFLGRITGLAIFHSKVIDATFAAPFYKSLLGQPVGLGDLATLDTVYHQSLVQLLENPDADQLMLNFTVDYNEGGVVKSYNLTPDGDKRAVTDANKGEYVDLLVRWQLLRGVYRQMDAFRKGLAFVVDIDVLKGLEPAELAQLTGGVSHVDINDWRAHTTHENGYTAESQPVVWFWQALASFTQQQQCQVLKFATGASRPPAQGFAGLSGTHGSSSFCLYRNDAVNSLPVGHTCVNRLDLPAYTSYEMLLSKLTMAIEETEGFGIV